MKKLFRILVMLMVAVVAVGVTSCGKSKGEKAREEIARAVHNMDLPMKINNNTTLTDCEFKGNTLYMHNEVPAATLAAIDREELRDSTLRKLRGGMLPRKLVKRLVEANASIEFVYYNGDDSISINFPASKLH
ncbi:MAG: hypothetical protein K2L83_07315 [Muribaculaceae bacterium]|nr:hypothetical protein [Muribaculaceae bacterium]MDE6330502.1 hypothetical protein [Muribaculaceae bacterium]